MRLIDADALFDDLIFPSKQFERGLRELIGEAPTIDAVPVVRCWECAAYRSMEKSGGLCKNTGFWVPENGFCHDGERKDGADNA